MHVERTRAVPAPYFPICLFGMWSVLTMRAGVAERIADAKTQESAHAICAALNAAAGYTPEIADGVTTRLTLDEASDPVNQGPTLAARIREVLRQIAGGSDDE